jgi:putative hydrolase of the HAD superfamily
MAPVIRAVLLDLDDTLMDHQTAAGRAVVHWAESMGLRGDPDELAARWAVVSNRHYARYQRRELTAREQQRARARDFLPHLDLRADDEAQAAFDAYLALYRAAWTAFPDAAPALRQARGAGLRVGVLTNGEEAMQAAKLARGGLTGLVDELVASSTLPWSKPDPRSFLAACERLGSAPAETLMVGDSLPLDVHGARDAGLPAVLLDRYDAHPAADLRGGVRVRDLAGLARGR